MNGKISEKQLEEYKLAFNSFDQNGDGCLSSAELELVLKKLGLDPSKENIRDLLNEIDVDQNGTIDFTEFVSLMSKKSSSEEDELREAFNVFDKDGNGSISAGELKSAMSTLGEKLTDIDIDEMIKHADKDGDGQINYIEFLEMMKGEGAEKMKK